MSKNHYNTKLKPILLRAYGRVIQDFIHHIKEIEDKERRNHCAKLVVKLMKDMQPFSKKNRGVTEQALWEDLLTMADHALAITPPFPLPEKKELTFIKRKAVDLYSKPAGVLDRNYGKYVQQFALQIKSIADEKKRSELSEALGKLMVQMQRKQQSKQQQIVNYIERIVKTKVRPAILDKPRAS